MYNCMLKEDLPLIETLIRSKKKKQEKKLKEGQTVAQNK